jgi:hypothetical protein
MILGNKVGGSRDAKTYKVVLTDGETELGIFDCACVDEYTEFTAHPEDVAEGKVFACDEGVCVGTNDYTRCRVTHGEHEVYPGVEFMITLENDHQWDYTYFTGMIYPKREDGKKVIEKLIMDDGVYDLTGKKVADVIKDPSDMTVRLNLANMTDRIYILSYFTYREDVV